jgi:hypothetical protein
MAEPAVRARSAQQAYEALDAFRPGTRDRVRDLAPEQVAAIEASIPSAYLPLSVDGPFVMSLVKTLGEEEAERFWRGFVVGHVRSPGLRPIIDTAVRLFGVNPGTFFWALTKGLDQSYRDFGVKRLERDASFARFTLSDVHPEVMRYPAYFVCLRAVCGAMIDLARSSWTLDTHLDAARSIFTATARARE